MKHKIEVESAGYEDVVFSSSCVDTPDPNPPPNSYDPFEAPVYKPDYVKFEQRFVDDPSRGRSWKACQNYKVFSSQPDSKRVLILSAQRASGACVHKAKLPSDASLYGLWSGSGYQMPFGGAGRADSGLPAFLVIDSGDGYFVPAPANLDALTSMALTAMLPNIKENLSLINSIIELKDFKSFPGLVRRFKEIVPYVLKSIGSKPSKTFKDLAQFGAESFLQWNFAIKPLISDIRGILTTLTSLERRINDLITREGKTRTQHFQYNWDEFQAVNDVQQGLGLDMDSSLSPQIARSLNRKVTPVSSKFHAEIQYNYNYTEYQREHARVLGYLDALGINFNPQIIWNALPWSFVIDWVIGVNQFLANFKVQNMAPRINIHQYLWSIKRERVIEVDSQIISAPPNFSYLIGDKYKLPTIRETSYRRDVGMPSVSSLTASGLSLSELTLGAALVISRRRRRRNR